MAQRRLDVLPTVSLFGADDVLLHARAKSAQFAFVRAYVITVLSIPESERVARRCIASGAEHGVEIKVFPAVEPRNNPEKLMDLRRFPLDGFRGNKYSRWKPVLSCFLSHAALWETSASDDEPVYIFEHDAFVTAPIPTTDHNHMVGTFSKPSFGAYSSPSHKGWGPLVQKRYFGGAHGYVVSPEGADALLIEARKSACPVDVFLHTKRFPWLTEYAPWTTECRDSFSTVQHEEGTRAKHNKVVPLG